MLYLYPLYERFLYFITYQVKLHITEKALRLIAKKAMVKNTGARGLRAILEDILTEAMFEVFLVNGCTFNNRLLSPRKENKIDKIVDKECKRLMPISCIVICWSFLISSSSLF